MSKETEPDRPGTHLLNSVKSKVKKQQKETKMKNLKNNQTFKTVMHVVLTLLTLAVIGAIFYAGFTFGEKHARSQEAYIQSQVQAKVLSANAEAPKAEDSKK